MADSTTLPGAEPLVHEPVEHGLSEVTRLRQRVSELEAEVARHKSVEQSIRERVAALEQSHEELDEFLENAVEGVHWVGPDGTILRANKAELQMLGYAAEEYIGHHIAEFHADSEVIDSILTRLTCDEVLHNQEARLRCKD